MQSSKWQWFWSFGLLLALGASCRSSQPAVHALGTSAAPRCRTTTRIFLDSVHHRSIPVRTYVPASGQITGLKVALLNHGYGIPNSHYAHLARHLVARGYFVLSVQQVLPTDAPLPTTGNPAETRRPAWERGVQSLRAVLAELPRAYPGLDLGHTLLVGHSFGGDIVMLFAQEYPAETERVISLDNCRMPLPRQALPRVLSLRSSDQQPDPCVLPTPAEQAALGMRIVQLPATRHGELDNHATKTQQQEINCHIDEFLAL